MVVPIYGEFRRGAHLPYVGVERLGGVSGQTPPSALPEKAPPGQVPPERCLLGQVPSRTNASPG